MCLQPMTLHTRPSIYTATTFTLAGAYVHVSRYTYTYMYIVYTRCSETCVGMMEMSWSATGRRELAATALTSSSTSCRPLRMEGERRGRRVAQRSCTYNEEREGGGGEAEGGEGEGGREGEKEK